MDFLASTHLHITTWVIGIIVFFIAASMASGSKGKKVSQMILRVMYILILLTGFALFMKGMDYNMGMLYGFKMLGGLLVIGMMEMVLAKQKKQQSATMFWVLFFVFLFITMFLGFKLPMGINFLA